jgi:hypothetical protein
MSVGMIYYLKDLALAVPAPKSPKSSLKVLLLYVTRMHLYDIPAPPGSWEEEWLKTFLSKN